MFYSFDDFTSIINYHRYIDDDDGGEKNRCRRIYFLSLFSLYARAPDSNKLIDKHKERETPNTLYHYLSFTYMSTYADMLISLLWKTRPEEFNTNELCVYICVCVNTWMRTSSINMTTYTLKRFMPFYLITWSSLRDMIRVYSLWCVDRYCRVR
jgi:hypothetical protein